MQKEAYEDELNDLGDDDRSAKRRRLESRIANVTELMAALK